ncbi:MAG: ATPase domain-containing protein [Candidatus Altiarchaeota archaeon]
MEIERVPTNITGLDQMIGGGFEKHGTVLLSGGCGTGKSTFGLQFIYEGVKLGETGLYVTIEEPIESVLATMSSYGWNLDDLKQKDKIHIMRVKPEDLISLVKNEFNQITTKIKEIKAQRVVIDSISAVESIVDDEIGWRRTALKLYLWLREQKCTSLLIMERPHDSKIFSKHGIVEFMVDAVISLYTITEGFTKKNALEIVKMRRTNHSRDIVLFKFEKGGIQIYPGSKIF